MNSRAAFASLFMTLAAHAAENAAGVGTAPSASLTAPASAIAQPLAASSSADAEAPTAPTAKHAHDDESLMRLKETPPDPAFGVLALSAIIEATAESDNEARATEAQPEPQQEQGRSTEPVAPRAQSGKAKTPPQAR